MILLDTNVVSEVMRVQPATTVIAWMNSVNAATLYLSSITIAEISYGIRSLADGRRRDALRSRFEDFVRQGFSSRVLDFDEPAAYRYGELMARRRDLGQPMSVPDGQIAAIASTHRFAIATRDIRGFEGVELDLINPWNPH